jgi:hypothetical protein
MFQIAVLDMSGVYNLSGISFCTVIHFEKKKKIMECDSNFILSRGYAKLIQTKISSFNIEVKIFLWWSQDIALCIFNLGTKWRWVLASCSTHFIPGDRASGSHWMGVLTVKFYRNLFCRFMDKTYEQTVGYILFMHLVQRIHTRLHFDEHM